MTLIARVSPGVFLDIFNRGASLLDRHMINNFFFRNIHAIADKSHVIVSFPTPNLNVLESIGF